MFKIDEVTWTTWDDEELEEKFTPRRSRNKRFPAGALKQRRTPKIVREDGKRNKVSPRVKGARE